MSSKLIEIISRSKKLLDFMDRYHLTGLINATEGQLREYVKEEFGIENTEEIEDRWYHLHSEGNKEPYPWQCKLFG